MGNFLEGSQMSNPGEILKEERVRRGLSLREVSDKIKISPSFLEAIEKNHLEYLPGGFFKRNFVRAYARFLELNEDNILRAFNLVREPVEVEKIEVKKSGKRALLTILISSLLVISFFTMILFLKKDSKPIRESSPNPAINFPTKDIKPEKINLEQEKIEITIKGIDDTWLDADLDGKNVLYRILKKGEEVKYEGKEFVFNTIGKPEGIIVFINGVESIPMGSPGKVTKNIKIDAKNFKGFLKK